MRELESERARGRNYYPVRAVWNLMLAGVVVEPVWVLKKVTKKRAHGEPITWQKRVTLSTILSLTV